MMYYIFMETLRKNEYFLTRDVAGEILQAPGTVHYHVLPNQEIFNRVHQIIYHVYKRHAAFLDNESSRNTMESWYSNLGQERYHEGIPLEEVVEALFMVRRRVMRSVEERMHPEEDWSMRQASKLYWNVSLFFDALSRAVIEGYRKESGSNRELSPA